MTHTLTTNQTMVISTTLSLMIWSYTSTETYKLDDMAKKTLKQIQIERTVMNTCSIVDVLFSNKVITK